MSAIRNLKTLVYQGFWGMKKESARDWSSTPENRGLNADILNADAIYPHVE
jgi:hypothetical protein